MIKAEGIMNLVIYVQKKTQWKVTFDPLDKRYTQKKYISLLHFTWNSDIVCRWLLICLHADDTVIYCNSCAGKE